jgi:single-strand DNA-binding protein
MQKTLLIGYLGKDPEMKYIPRGTAIATFTIAITERWKNSAGEPQEHTEWFNIKAFGKRAEVVAEHLHKGSRIFLEGRQRTESWDDSSLATRST